MAVSKAGRKALGIDPLPAELRRAMEWLLGEYRGVMADVRTDLVDALRDGLIDPTSLSSIEAVVEQRIGEYTTDLFVVFREGTDRGTHAGRELAARRFMLDVDFSLVPTRVLDEWEAWSREATRSSLRTLTENVTDLVRGAQVEGMSVQATAEALDEMFGNRYVEDASWKSQQLARSALIPSSNAGSHSAYRDARGVVAETWLATLTDNRTRRAHRRIHDQTVGVDTPFLIRHEGRKYEARFPGDPTLPLSLWINERCTVIPTFADQLTESQLGTIRSGGRVQL